MPTVRTQPGSTTPGLGRVSPNPIRTTPGLLDFCSIESKLCVVCSPLIPTSSFRLAMPTPQLVQRSVRLTAKPLGRAAKDGPKVLYGTQCYACLLEGTGSDGSSRGSDVRSDASSCRPSEFPLSVTLNSAGPYPVPCFWANMGWTSSSG